MRGIFMPKEAKEKLAVNLTVSAGVGENFTNLVGDRELPIYSVDTKENKVALSFDEA